MMGEGARVRGRVGGLTTVARYGPDKIAARAREGLRARFLREADPSGELPHAERERRARLVQRRYYAHLSMRSAAMRRQRGGRSGTA